MRIASLHVYPVKSCRGVSLQEAEVEARGLALDRRWMVVDAQGDFLTQRTVAQLGTVSVHIEGESLEVEAPGLTPYRFAARPIDGPRLRVRVWRDMLEAIEDEGGSAWFSRALGLRCHLVHQPDTDDRTAGSAAPSAPVSLADAYPLLAIGQASLDDLVTRVGHPLAMARFRPNLVIAGSAPYEEDDWGAVRIGGLSFHGVKRCDRCVVTTLDPDTLQSGHEPLRTLATYRRWDGKVWFGMNLVPDARGRLRVDDPVELLAPFSG